MSVDGGRGEGGGGGGGGGGEKRAPGSSYTDSTDEMSPEY